MIHRWLSWLLVSLVLLTPVRGVADDPPTQPALPTGVTPASMPPAAPTAHLDDALTLESANLRDVFKAMRAADIKALFDLYNAKDPIVHVMAAIAIERTRFNLDVASKDAKVCEDNLFKSNPGVALTCAQLHAGDLRLAGQWQAALDAEADIVRRYQGSGRGIERVLANLQAHLDQESGVPQFSVDPVPASDTVVKLHHDAHNDDSRRPFINAKANGHDMEFVIDTGAGDLLLDQGKARDLGVQLLGAHGRMNGVLARGIETQRGILQTLQIGALVLRNVPVVVTPSRNALIGANVLAPLGDMRITEKELTVYGSGSQAPSCDRDMQVGTDVGGHTMRILPQFLLNGEPHQVMLDTGAESFLLGSKAAVDEVKRIRSGHMAMNDVGGSHMFANAEAAKVDMQIDRQPFQIYFIVYTDSSMPYDIILGANAMRDMDYVFDFRQHRLCFPMHEHMR